MRAESVEVSWDADKSKWLVRIQSGEEVIRRHCDLPKSADESKLRSAVKTTVEDEGYELDAADLIIHRPAA
jgi:hypothetical protein